MKLDIKRIDVAETSANDQRPAGLARAECVGFTEAGRLQAKLLTVSEPLVCDLLASAASTIQVGDDVLIWIPDTATGGRAVVLGKVCGDPNACISQVVNLVASESLSLQCGQSKIEMKANGKVLIKGEDVVIRAKGTQRIRAGTVAIN